MTSFFYETISKLVKNPLFTSFIIILIIINAITLGLETSPKLIEEYEYALHIVDQTILWIFVIEILLKIYVYRFNFFKDGWNIFDFLIVGISLLPSSGILSILRALRILRVLRLISIVPSLRAVIQALFNALPGMSSIITVLLLIFYVASVMATKLFKEHFPEFFGTIGNSMYSLFQIMTLESWSMGIVRPVMEVYPYAWIFFVPFIVITSFAVLNLFIGIIVNSLHIIESAQNREHIDELEKQAHREREELLQELRALRKEVAVFNKNADNQDS